MACTGVSSRTGYDAFCSTMTYREITYCTMTSQFPVGYKATPLQGYVSRVFFIHSTVIRTVFSSLLYPLPLPKDQTLKHTTTQLESP